MSKHIPVADARARFYRILAVALLLGLFVAGILGLAGLTGPGWFTPDEAFFSLAAAFAVAAFVLLVFLLRMVSIFDDMDRIRASTLEEARQAEQARQKVVGEVATLRDAVQADLEAARKERESQAWGLQETVRREVEAAQAAFAATLRSGWERDVGDIRAAALRAEKDADARLTRAEAALHQATQAAEERARMDLAAAQKRDLIVMQKEAEVTRQVQELQEAAAALRNGLRSVEKRVAEAVEGLERREMEVAAERATAERSLTDVRKRAELLVIKNRELEDAVAQTDEPKAVRLTERDLKDHVISIEGIGPRYAALLNAAGVISIHQLAKADPDHLAKRVDAMPGLVEEWQAMARLIPVRGVGPQYAELLVRAGVKTVEELATSDSHKLFAQCQKALDGRKVKIVSGPLSEATVNRWIQAARAKDYA